MACTLFFLFGRGADVDTAKHNFTSCQLVSEAALILPLLQLFVYILPDGAKYLHYDGNATESSFFVHNFIKSVL
jgi:hypothetical protein